MLVSISHVLCFPRFVLSLLSPTLISSLFQDVYMWHSVPHRHATLGATPQWPLSHFDLDDLSEKKE